MPGRRGSWMVAIASQQHEGAHDRVLERLVRRRPRRCVRGARGRRRWWRRRAGATPSSSARARHRDRPASRRPWWRRPGVAGGEAGELVGGGGEVGSHHQHVTVGLRHHHGRIGREVRAAPARRPGPARRRGRGGCSGSSTWALLQESWANPGRSAPRCGCCRRRSGLRLQHQDLEPGAGEVGRRDQRVVSRADDDHLGAVGQVIGALDEVSGAGGDGRISISFGAKPSVTATTTDCKRGGMRAGGRWHGWGRVLQPTFAP